MNQSQAFMQYNYYADQTANAVLFFDNKNIISVEFLKLSKFGLNI
jgi:hypothetical protein